MGYYFAVSDLYSGRCVVRNGSIHEALPEIRLACYANHVEEVAGKTEVMNVFEYKYETEDKEGEKHTTRFR